MNCGLEVDPSVDGSYRNHCPVCLWSLHVDDRPGDRANACRRPMEPIGLTRPRGKGLAVVHRCTWCRQEKVNRLAADDDLDAILAL